MLGMHGTLVANRAVAECDLLIVAGARLDDRATGAIETFCPEAQIVHMDIDPAELGKIRRADAALEGDLAATLTLLLPRLESAARPGWQARIDTLREAYGQSAHRNAPARLIREVAEIVGEEAIVSTDVGRHQMWAAQYYPTLGPRRWLTSGGLGTMGFGLPAAIGAAVACPDRTVVCFSGDGSLLMNIQELATAAEEAVNVKIVLFNNQSLGLVRQQQELFYGNRVFASDFRGTVDFGTLARAFGIPSVRIRCGDDHRRTLADVLCSPGPALIEVMTPAETHAHPMVPPGKANTEMILTDIQE
jgi:acetolactate synthase-1/2/3 large subunit